MICPTKLTFDHCRDWKQRFGFGWEIIYLPWPMDTQRIPFRQRTSCQRFVFINGWGGGHARYLDGRRTPYQRKGAELIAEVAHRCRNLDFVVYSQESRLPKMPPGVEVRPPPDDRRCLYEDGDVCVQPSHWEGIGMQLLECQAAGMPLVATDAPPMNEYQPLRTIPVDHSEVVSLGDELYISSQRMDARQLGEVLTQLQGADIREASRHARAFVERVHNWNDVREKLAERFVTYWDGSRYDVKEERIPDIV
jgi:glycosyltransferase involved in cell wall biosynthesis